MKRILPILLVLILVLTGCQSNQPSSSSVPENSDESITRIELSDQEILVNGETAPADTAAAVYTAHDIIFYLADQGFTYGAGSEQDEHDQSEADQHTVVHISQPGTYQLSGTLSRGQIAIDLGKDASEDPAAVVTLILDGTDITCTVAPGIIFYNVYECGSDDVETASATVDTTAAGANVVLADGSVNTVNGSYVARIYKSYTLNEAGTEVIDNKKLHKYDGAFYSKMSMNISGGDIGDGILNINAENEGLDSELHLTLNGGNINIRSGNDGINTNEDEVSVTTINGGTLNILVSGETGEGDGIDSNGWLVINGGTVVSEACSSSPDSGLDSDMGIYLNGGTVIANGNMFDHISDSLQTYVVFNFAQTQRSDSVYTLKNSDGQTVLEAAPSNHFSNLVLSSNALAPGTYTLWQDDVQLAAAASQGGMEMGGFFGDGQPPEMPEGMKPGELPEMPKDLPDGFMKAEEPPEIPQGDPSYSRTDDFRQGERPEMPDGMQPGHVGFSIGSEDLSTGFEIHEGGNYFSFVSPVEN